MTLLGIRRAEESTQLDGRSTIDLAELRAEDNVNIVNTSRDLWLTSSLRLALSSAARLRGLIGASPLAPGEGLLLRPCGQIHTCFMRFSIDALFLDAAGVVVGLCSSLRPWRFSPRFRSAIATLELVAGSIRDNGVARGDHLAFISHR